MRRDRHLASQWLELVNGEADARDYLPLRASARARSSWQALRATARELQGPYAVYAAGATYGVTKRWPHFGELARRLQSELALTPLFIGSQDVQERRLCAELAARCGGIDFSGRTDFVQLSGLLSEAALCVGNDSGPAHLASALGTPTLTIFGSSSPAWTAPLGPRAESIGPAPIACSPCFAATCTIGVRCLSELEPAAVLERAKALWQRGNARA
jgi:heptosyltransferase-2